MPSTVEPIELLWTMTALVALGLHLWVGLDAWRDAGVLSGKYTRAEQLIRRANVLGALGLGWVQLVFALIGIRAMTVPSPTPTGDPDLVAVWAGFAFLSCEVVLAGLSLQSVSVRRRVREWMRIEITSEGQGGLLRQADPPAGEPSI